MTYQIEVYMLVGLTQERKWQAIHPTEDPTPYEYATRERAERIARLCYGRQTKDTVRVVEVKS